MKLSIITITYNNAVGLQKTIDSVVMQTCKDFEHIIIDGKSTDNSLEIIEQYENHLVSAEISLKWISECDEGIYNAMNKGIRMSSGDYVQFLNAGDSLASNDVVERMLAQLDKHNYPPILYGNMLKDKTDGVVRDRCFAGAPISFLGFYTGTLNHSPAYIRRDLFEKYGFYDKSLKIVSDWKWYLKAIILGNEVSQYADIDVTLFDMHGISETNKDLDRRERRQVLEELFPAAVLHDYDSLAFEMNQMKRLKRHAWAYRLVWLLERCLARVERWQDKHKSKQVCK